MGVRLVKYGIINGTGTYNHDELNNRDLPDQHPISSITGLEDRIKEVEVLIGESSVIDQTIDTPSISLIYDKDLKSLAGNVKVFNSEDNALVEKTSGLYVDKYLDIETQDTESVHLTVEGKGETLKTMYDTGARFSHNGTWTNIAVASEANAWYYDATLQSFVQPQNTGSYTGFVSTVKYRTYTHRATLKSTDSDNDGIGVIVAYAIDESGKPHTLSLVINKGGESHVGSYYYALIYDKDLPDQQILFTKGNKTGGTVPGNHSTSGWSGSTITVEVNKAGASITCAASNYNSTTINYNTLIEINLDDYSWGSLFRSKVQYGYCAQSQPKSFFQNIYFTGKGPLKANVILSKEEDNILQIRDDGVYLSGENFSSGMSQIKVMQTAHGFVVGDALYNTMTGYKKGLANESTMVEIVGVVAQVTDANNFKLCTGGFLETARFDSYINGTVLFLSETVLGDIISAEPTKVSKQIAIKTEKGIVVNIQKDFVIVKDEDINVNDSMLNIDDHIGDFKYSNDTVEIRKDGYILFKENIEYEISKVKELLAVASEEFKNNYVIVRETTISFINTDAILHQISYNGATSTANLYIKAFSNGVSKLHEHENKEVLDKFSELDGLICYNDMPISSGGSGSGSAESDFVAKKTTFAEDGTITETYEDIIKITSFHGDGSITIKLTDLEHVLLKTKRIVFNVDNSITEVVY